MPTKNPAVTAYIANAAPFARPILRRLRSMVHRGCPSCVEVIKWGAPHFDCKGPLCGMAAFKAHCAFGFWKAKLLADGEEVLETADRSAMGHLGRITSVEDLPSEKALLALLRQAARLNEVGVKAPRVVTKKAPLRVPSFMMAAIRANRKALATFEGFSPSHRREYVEWITEAKTDATRDRRIATMLAWLAEGKSRNWKYAR